jgi:hypothetical protein
MNRVEVREIPGDPDHVTVTIRSEGERDLSAIVSREVLAAASAPLPRTEEQ